MEDEGSGNEGLCLLTSEEPLETSEEHARRREKERREEERRGHGRGSLLTAEVQALQTDPAWMLLLYEDLENAFAVHAIPVQTLQRLWYRLQRAQEEQGLMRVGVGGGRLRARDVRGEGGGRGGERESQRKKEYGDGGVRGVYLLNRRTCCLCVCVCVCIYRHPYVLASTICVHMYRHTYI
jgi:hypothetical protein